MAEWKLPGCDDFTLRELLFPLFNTLTATRILRFALQYTKMYYTGTFNWNVFSPLFASDRVSFTKVIRVVKTSLIHEIVFLIILKNWMKHGSPVTIVTVNVVLNFFK